MTHAEISNDTAGRPSRRLSYILFTLAQQLYALPTLALREVVALPQLARPAGMPRLLAGYLHLGCEAVPVLHLARLLNLTESRPGLFTPLLLLKSQQGSLALLVDQVNELVTIGSERIVPISRGEAFNDCTAGIARVNDTHVIVLEASRLLTVQESLRLAALRTDEQQRLAAFAAESS